MEYFNLDSVKVKTKYKGQIDEVLEEVNNVVGGIRFLKVRPNQDGHAEVWFDERKSKYYACVKIPEIKKLDDLYLFFHECGHVVNRHLSDLEARSTIKQEEVINREKEADIYALNQMEKLLTTTLKNRDREKITDIIDIIKFRLNSGYEDYIEG